MPALFVTADALTNFLCLSSCLSLLIYKIRKIIKHGNYLIHDAAYWERDRLRSIRYINSIGIEHIKFHLTSIQIGQFEREASSTHSSDKPDNECHWIEHISKCFSLTLCWCLRLTGKHRPHRSQWKKLSFPPTLQPKNETQNEMIACHMPKCQIRSQSTYDSCTLQLLYDSHT